MTLVKTCISGGRRPDKKSGIAGRRGPQIRMEMHWVQLEIRGTWDLEPGTITW